MHQCVGDYRTSSKLGFYASFVLGIEIWIKAPFSAQMTRHLRNVNRVCLRNEKSKRAHARDGRTVECVLVVAGACPDCAKRIRYKFVLGGEM